MDIKLNFINRSMDQSNSRIVIFQKNEAETYDEIAVAWRVIQNCGFGDTHPFTYPMDFKVGVADSWGNFSPQLAATDGDAFEVVISPSGDVLKKSTNPAMSAKEVEIQNNLPLGSISGNIYRDGLLLATKTVVSPGQKAVFQFLPKIFVGVVSQIEQGQVMNSAVISQLNTEIDLFGVTSADLVLTGGGKGPDAKPFEFTLENVV